MSVAVELKNEKKVWTDEEVMALPEDGHRYEVVNGELVDMVISGALHGYVCSTLMIILGTYVRTHRLGVMFDSSTAFKMKNGNRRSLDLSFFAKERLQGMSELPSGFLVEVLSPKNTLEEIHERLLDYFANGTRLAWVVHPMEHYVLVYRSAQEPDRLLKSVDTLAGEEVLPGFTLPVFHLFQPLSF